MRGLPGPSLQWLLLGVALFGGIRLWQVLQGDGVSTPQPSAAQLQTWLAEHRERYDTPLRIDWQLASSAAPTDAAAARQLVQQLAAGEAMALDVTLQIKRGEPVAQVAQQWGTEFAGRLQALPPATWVALPAHDGWHAVRLNRLLPAHTATYGESEPALRRDWLDAAAAK